VTAATRAWISDEILEVDGTRFLVAPDSTDYLAQQSTVDSFVLVKARQMVDQMVELVDHLQPDRIVDLGIFKGGSTALFASLRPTAQVTAIDISSEPVSALEHFIVARGVTHLVHLHYGIDQSDAGRLAEIIDADHGTEPLDFVMDDASHLYRESRASFEVLFPRLRAGGLYVIEDWAWAHYPEELWQEAGGWFHDRPALTNLVVELLLTIGTNNELISEIRVSHNYVEVVRGYGEYARRITLGDHYANRGLPYRPLI
jgi:predicted O-methyltransferase YrrM